MLVGGVTLLPLKLELITYTENEMPIFINTDDRLQAQAAVHLCHWGSV